MALSISAYASSITVSSGDTFSVNFNGVVNGAVQDGLTSTADFTVMKTNPNTWKFTIGIDNTSTAPITASRVSVIGFDTNPNISSGSVTSGILNRVSSGNMPQLGSLDVCFKGTNGNNCAGGGGAGVGIPDGIATLMATLVFEGADVDQLTLDSFGVRYQSIAGSSYGTSGTGFGTVVPIPAALWMFLSALFGLVAMRRLRHRTEPDNDAAGADGVLQPA